MFLGKAMLVLGVIYGVLFILKQLLLFFRGGKLGRS
jgi:hypothetical protein